MNNRCKMVYTGNTGVIPGFLVAGPHGIGGAGAEDLHGVRKKRKEKAMGA